MPGLSGSVLLAIDQGTTNTKVLLVNASGDAVFRQALPLLLSTPAQGFVEQDPLELWSSVRLATQAGAAYASESGLTIAGVVLSNQRETALAWHRETGEPLGPAVSWQCRRSAPVCTRLASSTEIIAHATGLLLDPVLSATKWAWMLEHLPLVQRASEQGQLCFGTVDSWLIFKLTSGAVHATDTTNASRTGGMDLAGCTWSLKMLSLFGLPAASLPSIRSSSGRFGNATAIPELDSVPIVASLGDSHAALAGHGVMKPGAVKATYGTGSSLMTLTPALATHTSELARTVAWSIGEETQYALEGNIFMTGSAVQWVGEFLGLQEPTAGAVALAGSVTNAAGAYFVPAMVGLGAPRWDAAARGVFCGLERIHKAAHMAHAAIDSIAYQIADVFHAMEKAVGASLPELRADGGATRNQSLMQFQADILGVPVLRSETEEMSAIGAAYLGGLALGWWTSREGIAALPRAAERILPTMSSGERDARYAGWQQAVRHSLSVSQVMA